MDVKQISTDKVIPYARNPRRNEAAVAKVAASIKEFGFRQPIVVDSDMVVIVGHTRLLAARQLGLGKVPVHIAKGLTAAQIKAYRLADNRVAQEAEWDDELLSLEIGELQNEIDLTLTGFDDREIARLLAGALDKEGLTDDDTAPQVQPDPVSVIGDCWRLGQHRVLCGDATLIDDVEKLMSGAKADMVFTDPPYGIRYGGGRARGDHVRNKQGGVLIKAHGEIMGDDLNGLPLQEMITGALSLAVACKKSGGAAYVCFTWRAYSDFESALVHAGLKPKACIVWDKKSIGLGYADYRPQHEFIFYCDGQWFGESNESDVWQLTRGTTGDYVHPTQKPVELVQRALRNSSKAGDLVLDLFGGSGSTMIACEKSNRSARLMELDPKYVDVIIRRWQGFTGQEAFLEGGKDSFSAIEQQRKAA